MGCTTPSRSGLFTDRFFFCTAAKRICQAPGAFGQPNHTDAIYDLLDALYVPLAGGSASAEPGPQIEIWQLRGYDNQAHTAQTPRTVFAQAYVRAATEALGRSDSPQARAFCARALSLDPRCAEAHYALAIIHHIARDLPRAEMHYKKQLALREDPAALMNLAIIYESQKEH